VIVPLSPAESRVAMAGRCYLANRESASLVARVQRLIRRLTKLTTPIPGAAPYRAFPEAMKSASLFDYRVGKPKPNPWAAKPPGGA
jgi:hypothetical protein